MKKLILFILFLSGLSLEAQTMIDFQDCVQEFFDNLSDLNQTIPGETEGMDKVRVFQRIYQGEFFDFNGCNDVSLNDFITYYKTYVLGNATVTHDIVGLSMKVTRTAEESLSFRLSNIKIRRKFEGQESPASSPAYTDEISCNMLVTWMGEDANPRIRINGISYTEPLEKTPQVIATKRIPVFKVSNASASVSAYSGSHHVSVTSYCDTEYIYTNGKSKVKREDLSFKVIGDRYEVKDNEVRFGYSSNPNRQERILSWTLEQNETRETRKVTLKQEKRKIKINLFDYDRDIRGYCSINYQYIPNGLGYGISAYTDSRFGFGMIYAFTFHKYYSNVSSNYFITTTENAILDDGSTKQFTINQQPIEHSDVQSAPQITVKKDMSFYIGVGCICSFAINTYLDIEYSPMYIVANHRYDLDGTWQRIITTSNYNGKKEVIVDYQKVNSKDQRVYLDDKGKKGFMNRVGVRAFIPLGFDCSLTIGYGYNINTIKGIPNYSDFSTGLGIAF
jgi:hypothetical protein